MTYPHVQHIALCITDELGDETRCRVWGGYGETMACDGSQTQANPTQAKRALTAARKEEHAAAAAEWPDAVCLCV